MSQKLVVVRGAGDLATGIIYTLYNFGYRVVSTELEHPSSIRRTVSLCEAIYEGTSSVENVAAELCKDPAEINRILSNGNVPILIDPDGEIIWDIKPDIVVDAILAKNNTGTLIDMAKIVIGVGPGFFAGKDCHAVVETKRGHTLGRVILDGGAEPNTGIPSAIGGYSIERVIYSPKAGIIRNIRKIGDQVKAGEVIAAIGDTEIKSKI